MTELPTNKIVDQGIRARVMFDVSTLSRWAGPDIGIIRVERELARWALQHVKNAVFVFFDPKAGAYREVKREWIAPIIEGTASINRWTLANTKARRHKSDLIPHEIKHAAMWILQFRRNALFTLERMRHRPRPAARVIAERLQQALITEKYRPYLFNVDGTRRTILASETMLGPEVEFNLQDTLVCVGTPWEHSDIHSIKALKESRGFRFVVLCHDIIPLQFPYFYKQTDVIAFRQYYNEAFPLADLVVFTAQTTERDTLAYCKMHHLRINDTRVVPPGADAAVPRPSSNNTPPPGLKRGHYVVLVSTVEPRKGHQMIYNVWLRLLAEGVPQKKDFKLVFAGRPGWNVGALIDRLKNDTHLGDSFQLLTSLDDDQLASLYDGAAFCLYPSIYEGYGLPIVEAFFRQKAVLASTGGAIPEVVAGFSPCLDPHDESKWYSMLRQWIVDPAARTPYETAIRTRFRATSWRAAAQQFFQTIDPTERISQ